MSAITNDRPTSEELLQEVQDLDAPFGLHHREFRLDLPTGTASVIPKDRNAEAALAVDKADDPLLNTWPFLLIVRTGRIFTEHAVTVRRRCDMNEYRRMLGVSSK